MNFFVTWFNSAEDKHSFTVRYVASATRPVGSARASLIWYLQNVNVISPQRTCFHWIIGLVCTVH